ncbi:MAG: ArsR family transcriptional regulator [Anaerolineae bacterium]
MSATPYPQFLSLIAHELRWSMLTALAQTDLRAQELVQRVGQPQNLVSYHLRQLKDANLVSEHRSSADRRDVYYSLNLTQLEGLYVRTGQALHPLLGGKKISAASDYPALKILVLCTHNSARSQMAEGILRHRTQGILQVASAGTQITAVHPYAVEVLAKRGIDIAAQRSKHVTDFVEQHFDYIITVCDRIREVCPTFPDAPDAIHWSLPDPVDAQEKDRYERFERTADDLSTRIDHFLLTIAQPAL